MRCGGRAPLGAVADPGATPKVLQRANGAGGRALQAARGTEDLRVPPGSAHWAGGPALLVCSCPPWSAQAFQVAPTRWSGGWAALARGEAVGGFLQWRPANRGVNGVCGVRCEASVAHAREGDGHLGRVQAGGPG